MDRSFVGQGKSQRSAAAPVDSQESLHKTPDAVAANTSSVKEDDPFAAARSFGARALNLVRSARPAKPATLIHPSFVRDWREAVPADRYVDLAFSFDETRRALHCAFTHARKPNVTDTLVEEFLRAYAALKRTQQRGADPDDFWMRYFVLRSNTPSIFSFGGDLGMFIDVIDRNDRDHLAAYAVRCIEACYETYRNIELPIVTISLVTGDALGGGLECALACDFVVAERSTQLGLTEILFGSFPGMGAYSFLTRKVGRKLAEEMILSGRLYTGEEMHRLGVVDVLAEDGQGEEALHELMARIDRKYPAYRALMETRRRVQKLEFSEMADIVAKWVDVSFRLSDQDLKKMRRLARMQAARNARDQEVAVRA